MSNSRYSEDWQAIATAVKQQANWRCSKCGRQCLRPDEDTNHLTKSERGRLTLNVHHHNRIPEDNRLENLIALCSTCHLSYHTRQQSNIPPGQLSFQF